MPAARPRDPGARQVAAPASRPPGAPLASAPGPRPRRSSRAGSRSRRLPGEQRGGREGRGPGAGRPTGAKGDRAEGPSGQAFLALLHRGPPGAWRPGASGSAHRPSASSALRGCDPRGPSTPPAAGGPSRSAAPGPSQAEGSAESANHIPKDEQPVAAPPSLTAPSGSPPTRATATRAPQPLQSPRGAGAGEEFTRTPPLRQTSSLRGAVLPTRPLRATWLLPLRSPPLFWSPLRNPPPTPRRAPGPGILAPPPRAAARLPPLGRSLPSP